LTAKSFAATRLGESKYAYMFGRPADIARPYSADKMLAVRDGCVRPHEALSIQYL